MYSVSRALSGGSSQGRCDSTTGRSCDWTTSSNCRRLVPLRVEIEVAGDLEEDARPVVGQRLHGLEEHEGAAGRLFDQPDRARVGVVRVTHLLEAGSVRRAAERDVGGLPDRVLGEHVVARDRRLVIRRLRVRPVAERARVHPGEVRVVERAHHDSRGRGGPGLVDPKRRAPVARVGVLWVSRQIGGGRLR